MPPTYNIAQAKQAVLTGDQSYFNRIIPPFAIVDPTGASPPSRRSGTTAVVLPAPRAQDAGCTVFSLKDIAYYNFYSVSHSGGLGHAPFAIGTAPDASRAFQFNRPAGYLDAFSNQAYQRAFAFPGIRQIGVAFKFFLQSGYNHGLDGKHIGGIWGGNSSARGVGGWTGGVPPEKQTGITLRNTWVTEPSKQIRTQAYIYCLNRRQARVGDLMYGGKSQPPHWGRWPAGSWPIGQWISLEYEAKMNTPGFADGFARMWINGQQVAEVQDCIWAIDREFLWRGVQIGEYWGSGTVASGQKVWVKDVVAYATGRERPVPDMRGRTRSMAEQMVLAAGLTPAFTGGGLWVFSQSPGPGIWVPEGSTVTMSLRSEGRK